MAQVLVLALLLTLLSPGSPVPVPNPGKETKLNILETLLEANVNMGDVLIEGDIVKDKAPQINGSPDVMLNADPCTATTCKWPKKADGNVYVPIVLDTRFGTSRTFIRSVLQEIGQVTCIRFMEINKREVKNYPDYINIIPDVGCWSYVGRIGGVQNLSLQLNGCVYTQIIQHEIFHALGFHHEHTRSDRDENVNIHFENIIPETVNNFNMANTNNLQTTYDFNSVMQYSNYAFSANGAMTISAKSNPALLFGYAQRMSPNDILRVNKLYECSAYLP